MVDLSVNLYQLNLKSPIIAGSCDLTSSIEKLQLIEKAGAGAIVLKSIFEEEIYHEFQSYTSTIDSFQSTMEFLDYYDYEIRAGKLEEFIKLIRTAKESISIPIIASINCTSSHEWALFAKEIEKAGADAIEINISILPSNISKSSTDYERLLPKIIEQVKLNCSIPIGVKVSPYFTGLAKSMYDISKLEIDHIILFNRFYNSDIDIHSEKLTPSYTFSTSNDSILPLRWTAMLYKRLNTKLVASTGIHTSEDIIKMLLAGADAIQLASVLYEKGIPYIETLNNELSLWMEKHKYTSIDEFRGKLSIHQNEEPSLWERAQFMKHFGQFENHHL